MQFHRNISKELTGREEKKNIYYWSIWHILLYYIIIIMILYQCINEHPVEWSVALGEFRCNLPNRNNGLVFKYWYWLWSRLSPDCVCLLRLSSHDLGCFFPVNCLILFIWTCVFEMPALKTAQLSSAPALVGHIIQTVVAPWTEKKKALNSHFEHSVRLLYHCMVSLKLIQWRKGNKGWRHKGNTK